MYLAQDLVEFGKVKAGGFDKSISNTSSANILDVTNAEIMRR